MENLPPILTVYIIKDYLGIGMRQAYDLMHSGKFPVVRVNRRLLVSRDRFLEWLDKGDIITIHKK